MRIAGWNGKGTRRQRKIWLALWGSALGTVLLIGLFVWVEGQRDTDFADPTAGVTATFRSAKNVNAPPIRLRDVAQAMGITVRHGPGDRGRTLPEDTGAGVAWGDYDGDGDWDLYVVNFPGPAGKTAGPEGANRLYRNDGERFTDVTDAAGVGDPEGFGMGATFADYDDDGDQDIYVTNYGPNRLYRNRGDGTFEEAAAGVGVADPLWSTGAAWGDFDRDGHVDLYVCNYVEYDDSGLGAVLEVDTTTGSIGVPFTLNPNSFDPEPNRLYRNRGDGTFEEVAERCGVDNPEGRSLAATFCDLDGDGWLDLYVNNDVSTNRLFRNMGEDLEDGGFRDDGALIFADLSSMTGTADPRGSMGLSIGEIGGMTGEPDGFPDLFLTHWVAQEYALYESLRFPSGDVEYRDKTRQLRLGEISIDTVGWGCALVDLDLDGRVDLAVANGSTLERPGDPGHLVAEPQFIFWSDGKRFHDIASSTGPALAGVHSARGLAAADFDGDGDVDIALGINRGQPLLLRNETQTANSSLRVRLRGPAAACFGAKVEVVVDGVLQVQWWGADVTFLGMHAPELIFGLGEKTTSERVHVAWTGGETSTLNGVSGSRIEIVYPGRDSVQETDGESE